jgi:DNA-binding beta-propeller fold protein YncE
MTARLPATTLVIAGCLVGFASWALRAEQRSPQTSDLATQLRRPLAAAFLDEGQTLCVANQRSGSVSVIDLPRASVREEFSVGKHLTGLAVLPDHKHVLITDDERHELIALTCDGSRITVRARLAVGPYPISVAVLPDGNHATVASLWSHRLEVVDLTPLATAGPVSLRVLHTLHLPFAPRDQCVLPGPARVVVADAFGGRLAVVDAAAGQLLALHELNGHNLRGLALNDRGDQLLVSHQVLDQLAPTTADNIARGQLMANVVRAIPLDRLLRSEADLGAIGRLWRLDEAAAGAGDPAGLTPLADGRIAVTLAGVHQVAFIAKDRQRIRRVPVGRRPTAVVVGHNQPLIVVNTFDDSLSLLDPQQGTVRATISLGPQPKLSYKDRGELLFYDARLALDGWLSCNSCHTDGHSNGLLADTLGDGTYGTPKRTLTLLNTRMTDPWGWDGQTKYLHDNVRKSLEQTLHSPNVTQELVDDLTSFLHNLPPPPPVEPVTEDPADRQQVERGRKLFEARGCVNCHIPPLTYSSNGVHDVGFADERGLRRFNPPSLRGVSQGRHFLHDNRAATLAEVFIKYRHKVGAISEDDLADLLRFLRSL